MRDTMPTALQGMQEHASQEKRGEKDERNGEQATPEDPGKRIMTNRFL